MKNTVSIQIKGEEHLFICEDEAAKWLNDNYSRAEIEELYANKEIDGSIIEEDDNGGISYLSTILF